MFELSKTWCEPLTGKTHSETGRFSETDLPLLCKELLFDSARAGTLHQFDR